MSTKCFTLMFLDHVSNVYQMEIVGSFVFSNFKISWINAISKVGYVKIEKTTPENVDDFTEMWLIGNKIGKFLKTNEKTQAEAIAYHSLKTPTNAANINVFPRYTGDYEDNNQTYNIAENSVQPQTSTKEIILPLIDDLKQYLEE